VLLDLIEKHLKRHRMPPTRFGREAVGDPRFVFDLREGREPRSATVRRVAAYLDQFEPEVRR
jgi:2,4-dienoyl-CoA reductase-like NADH-dependent reductase (Old Yellow Enzyme family)